MKKLLFGLITLMMHFPFAHAQKAVLYFLNEKNGLSDNQVNCFLQDSRGVMWMGTSYGLNEYDGSRFRIYKNPAVQLSDNAIYDLVENEKQEIWIATNNGLSAYDLRKKTFRTFLFKPSHHRLNAFSSLLLSGDTLLLGTESGLVLFDTRHYKFHPDVHEIGPNAANHITRMYKDLSNQIWICTYNGLWRYNTATGKSTEYPTGSTSPNLLQHELVNDIIQLEDGTYWAGTWSKGLFSFSSSKPQPLSCLSFKGSHTNVTTLATLRNADHKKELWLSNQLSTVNIFEKRFDIHSFFGDSPYPDINVLKLYTDRNNILWIATNAGVYMYDPSVQFFNTRLLTNGIPYSTQGVYLLANKTGYWMGGENRNALALFDQELNMVKNVSAALHENVALLNIQEAGNGGLWISSNKGLFLSDATHTHFTHWSTQQPLPYKLPRDFINGIFQCMDGRLLLFPWRHGIWVKNQEKGFVPLLNQHGDTLLKNSNIAKAVEDSLGHIWFADLDHGFHRYDISNGTITTLIADTRFSNIFLINNDVWVTAAEGLVQTNIRNSAMKLYPFPEDKGKYIFNFMYDEEGGFWIATKSGLLYFDIRTKAYRYFTVSDGLYTNYLDVNFTRLKDGRILMAGSTFLTSFHPDLIKIKKKQPPVLLTQITSNTHDLNISKQPFETTWNENSLSFYWAFLHYNNPLENEFYYKMEGIDNDWKSAGNTGKAVYNNLQPGSYRFFYKARSSDRTLENESSVTFTVRPPYWQTWWFRLIMILVTVGVFFMIVRYIAQRNLKEKIMALEKKQAIEKERNRISRDMHDELGSGLTKIAILSEVMKKTTDEKTAVIDKISHTARSLVNNLDEMVWSLNPHNDTLQQLIAYVAEHALEFYENTDIEFDQEIPDVIPHLLLDEEKRRTLFLCIKEFLNNALKHSGATQVQISWHFQKKGFSFVLKDNGHGFDINEISKNGNGLRNMENRMKEIKAHYHFQSDHKGTTMSVEFHY